MKQDKGNKKESILSREDRKTSQGFVDIKTKTIEQLDELIERQNKLLQNRSFLEKLPDKGKKILLFKTELEDELKKRQEECEATCQLLSNLSLNDKVEEIEWNEGKLNSHEGSLDSDDDSDADREEQINPLKLVATHSGTASGKSIKINTSKTELVKKDNSDEKKIFYVDKFCEKYGKLINSKERFKPNQLRNNDKTLFVTSAEKIKKKLGNKWEVTQATPPVPIFNDTVMISLSESLKLQKEQAEKLKEIEKKYAAEKLLQNMSMKMGSKLPVNNVTEYRNQINFFDENAEDKEENEFNDLDDEDDEDKGKNVCFSTDNDEFIS